jgi:hypothetical protein
LIGSAARAGESVVAARASASEVVSKRDVIGCPP